MNSLQTALTWRTLGIACIPIKAQSKCPALESWKQYQERLPTERELEIWFGSGRYGLAVLVGWQNLTVLDFDDHWTHSRWLASLPAQQARLVMSTYRVATRRGQHYYLLPRRRGRNVKLRGLDIKAQGGYVLAPPTIHPTGIPYRAIGEIRDIVSVKSVGTLLTAHNFTEHGRSDHARQCLDPAFFDDNVRTSAHELLPKKFRLGSRNSGGGILRGGVDAFDEAWYCPLGTGSHDKYVQAALENEVHNVQAAQKGNRNNALFKAACALGSFIPSGALSESEVRQVLTTAALNTGLSEFEISQTLRSGLKTGVSSPRWSIL